jgi:UDP-2,3-diacylglucosamine pyrophosphatase LpxH
LHDQLHAQDVGQVVILGDLFDQWVIPTDLDPLPRLDDICNNPANQSIIDNLKELARSSRLSYVPGNHSPFSAKGRGFRVFRWVRRRQNEYQAYRTP